MEHVILLKQPIKILRWVVGGLFLVHGIYRISAGIVGDFGGFFTAIGWPLGLALAWTVTCLEIFSALCLIVGKLSRLAAIYLITQTIMGIILVHWPHGWFVVGAGRNGMEYSVLLIVCLVIMLITPQAQSKNEVSQ